MHGQTNGINAHPAREVRRGDFEGVLLKIQGKTKGSTRKQRAKRAGKFLGVFTQNTRETKGIKANLSLHPHVVADQP